MKPRCVLSNGRGVPVAPFVGAWIETSVLGFVTAGNPVAPFVGAWIETTLRIK